jgi:Arc/MetJ-type ribon-helix-helix transcriptional regulator
MSDKQYDTKLQVYVTNERKEEIQNRVDDGNWTGISDYVRHALRSGESNIADLDPRTSGIPQSNNTDSDKEPFVTNEELVAELDRLTNKNEDDFVDADKIVETFVEELKSDLIDRMFQMSQQQSNSVETDKVGGFKIDQ